MKLYSAEDFATEDPMKIEDEEAVNEAFSGMGGLMGDEEAYREMVGG